jgi:HK97 family phage major capsid protein
MGRKTMDRLAMFAPGKSAYGNSPHGAKKRIFMNLQELLKQKAEATARAEAAITSAETAKRQMNDRERHAYQSAMCEISALDPQIINIQSKNTISKAFPAFAQTGMLLTDTPNGVTGGEKVQRKAFSAEYMSDFVKYVQSNGREIGAALYEGGGGPTGGYAVPIVVDDQIVPLAPNEMSVRQISMVIPTSSDIKFPVKAGFGSASAKAETSSFTESELTLGQFTLSAFMAGILENVSWELAQDVPAFQSAVVDDMVLAQQMYEENLYVNGTGSGEAQGLIGNVGGGVTEEPDTNGNLVSVNGTLDIIGKLNAVYHPNASWLMSRPTSVIIRKSQQESNLFNPVWTRVGGQDFLHGYPVFYSASMPAATRGNAPILFGDFKRGYIIGDRGGSGINVKVLDQPLATQGLIQLLAYRRTDGRVRRSEAIQQYNISAS